MPRSAWLTPSETVVGYAAVKLYIPVLDAAGTPSIEFTALVAGALLALTRPYNFEQYGTLTPDQAASVCGEIYKRTFPIVAC